MVNCIGKLLDKLGKSHAIPQFESKKFPNRFLFSCIP